MMLPLKIGVLSASVLCAAMVLKLSLPAIMAFAYSELPLIWTVVMTWLRPPYLYVVINGIIITIVASSKLQHHKVAVDSPPEILAVPPAVVYGGEKEFPAVVYGGEKEFTAANVRPEYEVYKDVFPVVEEKVMTSVLDTVVEDKTRTATTFNADVEDVIIRDDDMSVSKLLQTPKRRSEEFPVSLYEKPPVSVRTGHRKAAKSISEGGRALRVSKPKRQETLETTWKTITEGRPMPLTRHLRKSDTWETRGHHLPQDADPVMTKSETFNASGDRHISPMPGLGKLTKEPSGSWKLKKDPSLSQDELNRRVEAFINKFNEDMRLQRQESLNQYREMINRGAH